ncbi:hypothetical protein DFJ77DRAFT_338222 [Powellomyces hirtus]|nr:hypothetical protein DFJ77DRAFT_338222 [Powellomyces hirtus]
MFTGAHSGKESSGSDWFLSLLPLSQWRNISEGSAGQECRPSTLFFFINEDMMELSFLMVFLCFFGLDGSPEPKPVPASDVSACSNEQKQAFPSVEMKSRGAAHVIYLWKKRGSVELACSGHPSMLACRLLLTMHFIFAFIIRFPKGRTHS